MQGPGQGQVPAQCAGEHFSSVYKALPAYPQLCLEHTGQSLPGWSLLLGLPQSLPHPHST